MTLVRLLLGFRECDSEPLPATECKAASSEAFSKVGKPLAWNLVQQTRVPRECKAGVSHVQPPNAVRACFDGTRARLSLPGAFRRPGALLDDQGRF